MSEPHANDTAPPAPEILAAVWGFTVAGLNVLAGIGLLLLVGVGLAGVVAALLGWATWPLPAIDSPLVQSAVLSIAAYSLYAEWSRRQGPKAQAMREGTRTQEVIAATVSAELQKQVPTIIGTMKRRGQL